MLLGHRGFSVPNDSISSTKSRCIIILKIKTIKTEQNFQNSGTVLYQVVDLYLWLDSKRSPVTNSDVFNPLVCRWVFSALKQPSASISSLLTGGRRAPRFLYDPASGALRPTCWLVVSSLFPASEMSHTLDDVVARNKDCKQDEAYSAWGKLNPGKHIGYNGLLQGHIHTVCYFLTSPFKCFPQWSKAQWAYSSPTGTPYTLQQPLCLFPKKLPHRLGYILRCWVMRSKLMWASPYLGILAHQFLPDRSGKPIPSWRASSSPGCGRWRRRTAALLHPAGRERLR